MNQPRERKVPLGIRIRPDVRRKLAKLAGRLTLSTYISDVLEEHVRRKAA